MSSDRPVNRRRFFREGLRELFKPLADAIEPLERAANHIGSLENFVSPTDSRETESAQTSTERAQVFHEIEEQIAALPGRQREAFLMRYWEEMDVAETAAAMGCSEGSVKTHCSRAVHALSKALKAKGISL